MALQAQRIAHQRDVAELESEISSQVSDFLVGLFEVADPTENAGEQITARDLLDRGASEIRHELKSGPLVRAALLDSMGWAYRGLGEYERAASLLEESLRLLDEDAHGAPARGPRRELALCRSGAPQGADGAVSGSAR